MFGMGTGGSLRLLSPEILGCQGSGSLPFPRTLKTAQVASLASPDQGSARSAHILSHKSLLSVTGLSSQASVPALASSVPCSFLPVPSFQDQALDRLVSPSSIHYCTSTDDLSTLSSSRGLTCFSSGNSLLWGGFTLRCLQRLSRPHFASLLCHWHDNSCTRGASIPVLSY